MLYKEANALLELQFSDTCPANESYLHFSWSLILECMATIRIKTHNRTKVIVTFIYPATRPSNAKVFYIFYKCPPNPVGRRQCKCFLCVVDEPTKAETLCEQEVLSGAFCEIGTMLILSLPISLCGSCNSSQIYEVTLWVAAKLPNHYCSLSTLNSNFIELIQEQWKAILRAQWNKDFYYEQCCSPLFQNTLKNIRYSRGFVPRIFLL